MKNDKKIFLLFVLVCLLLCACTAFFAGLASVLRDIGGANELPASSDRILEGGSRAAEDAAGNLREGIRYNSRVSSELSERVSELDDGIAGLECEIVVTRERVRELDERVQQSVENTESLNQSIDYLWDLHDHCAVHTFYQEMINGPSN